MARSNKPNAAALSPGPIFVSARTSISCQFSGCSLRKESSSLRACRQLSGGISFGQRILVPLEIDPNDLAEWKEELLLGRLGDYSGAGVHKAQSDEYTIGTPTLTRLRRAV
jgi:hypothetical protein